MSVVAFKRDGSAADPEKEQEPVHYLNVANTIKSWALTGDHKRIAIMYLVAVSIAFLLGGLFAGMIRVELTVPKGQFLTNDAYNKVFTAHGVVMIFFFLIPAIPAVLGNFMLPIMLGARDLAFPRLNLLSLYVYVVALCLGLGAIVGGGVDTGWTFYTPYSSVYSNSNVAVTIMAAFIAGFSSIFTGLNFIVTVHKMRAPGMTWFRMPLFIWAIYATSVIIMLGTPVVAITLALVVVERCMGFGIFSPEIGGDPVLFQHLFWFYSHPAVYIMILPSMGVINEVIAANSKKRIFGYEFVAFSTMAIAVFGFIVWGHHMFATSQSMYLGMVFSVLSFLVAVPSAVKVFNWVTTMYKGSVELSSHMLHAIGFLGLFTVGGLTGLYLSSLATDIHLTATYFVVAHFHYVMVGGTATGFLAGLHYWWPKMTGRMYSEFWGKISAALVFIGFNLTFFPQFIVGYLGMPRRYHFYPPEYQIWHILSTGGSIILGVGFAMPVFYLLASLKYGKKAGNNPWGAVGLEWLTTSPPDPHNFHEVPVVTWEAYEYFQEGHHGAEPGPSRFPFNAEDEAHADAHGEEVQA